MRRCPLVLRLLSERRASLVGLRLGSLNNSRWNANKLLRGTAVALGAEIEFPVVNYYVKNMGFRTTRRLK